MQKYLTYNVNVKSNVQNSIRLMLFWTLLMLLIPNTTVNCAITYTNCLQLGTMQASIF